MCLPRRATWKRRRHLPRQRVLRPWLQISKYIGGAYDSAPAEDEDGDCPFFIWKYTRTAVRVKDLVSVLNDLNLLHYAP